MKKDNEVIWPGTLGKIKNMLGKRCTTFCRWATTTGLGVFWIGLIVVAVIVGIAALLGLVVGIVLGIPALILYLALNWVVPVFGGPTISYWTSVGITILIPIVVWLIHGGK